MAEEELIVLAVVMGDGIDSKHFAKACVSYEAFTLCPDTSIQMLIHYDKPRVDGNKDLQANKVHTLQHQASCFSPDNVEIVVVVVV